MRPTKESFDLIYSTATAHVHASFVLGMAFMVYFIQSGNIIFKGFVDFIKGDDNGKKNNKDEKTEY